MIEVELPDGSIAEFPDGMPPEQIQAVLQQQFGTMPQEAPQQVPQEATAPERAGGGTSPTGHTVPEFQPVGVDGYDPATGEVSKPGGGWWDSIGAMVTGAEDVPIIGPAMKAGSAGIAAGIAAPFDDRSYGEIYSGMRDRQEQVMRDNPGSALAGQVIGTTALMAPIGATAGGAKALGMSGTLGQRALMSGVSGAGISGADTAVRGGGPGDIINSAVIGGGIGAALPVVGAGIRKGYGAARDKVRNVVQAARNPEAEAGRRVATALAMDKKTGAGVLGADDIATATRNNQPIMNADLGGENVRALARAAANQSPDARGMMERTVSDRFADQGGRVQRLISRITGGKVDDLSALETIKKRAIAENRPAYQRAYARGQNVWSPELQRLAGSDAVADAMRSAARKGRDMAINEGYGAFNPKVNVTQDGRILFPKTKPGRAPVYPDLQYWDFVKRNLDDAANAASRAGRNQEAATIRGLNSALKTELDRIVPEFKAARQGAAAFFGAEDAVDAGRNFAKSSRSIPEFKRGIMAMKPAEREAFRVGFASELIDQAKSAGDRTNVINRMFGSQEAREKLVLALGPQRAKEVEAFVRVETAMDALRGAFGNSTTARQLAEMGVIGGGAWWFTGDWKSGISAAALSQAPRYAAKKIDERVMVKMAEMLLSNDTKMIERAVANAAMSPQHMAALDALTKAAGITARSANVAISGN